MANAKNWEYDAQHAVFPHHLRLWDLPQHCGTKLVRMLRAALQPSVRMLPLCPQQSLHLWPASF